MILLGYHFIFNITHSQSVLVRFQYHNYWQLIHVHIFPFQIDNRILQLLMWVMECNNHILFCTCIVAKRQVSISFRTIKNFLLLCCMQKGYVIYEVSFVQGNKSIMPFQIIHVDITNFIFSRICYFIVTLEVKVSYIFYCFFTRRKYIYRWASFLFIA